MDVLGDLSWDNHSSGTSSSSGRMIVMLAMIFILVSWMSGMRLFVEVCVFGIMGHGMIVLYKGKGSPAIKRSSSSVRRRGVGNFN